MNRLTGTPEKLIDCMLVPDVQYKVYKRLEVVENALALFDLAPERLGDELRHLARLQIIVSAFSRK